jgi:hypothetical protein
MSKNWFVLVLLVVLSAGFTSCQKLPSGPPTAASQGPLALEKVKFQDAIPLEYGDLVGVTPHPETPKWAALWFEKPDKTVAVVWVNIAEGKLGEKVTTIPRK